MAGGVVDLKAIIALAMKDLRLLMRDRGGFLVTFIFPLVYCVFFGLIIAERGGGPRAIKIAVIDEDGTAHSAAMIERLRADEFFDVMMATAEEAEVLVRRGARSGFVLVPPGFGEDFDRVPLGDSPALVIGIDPSRQSEAAILQGQLTKGVLQGIIDSFADPATTRRRIAAARAAMNIDSEMREALREPLEAVIGDLETLMQVIESSSSVAGSPSASRLSSWQPVRFSTHEISRVASADRKNPASLTGAAHLDPASPGAGPRNSFEISFPQGMIWGVMGCAAAFAISLVTERASGTLARLRTTPIGLTSILAGKAAACFLATLAIGVLMLIVAVLGFGVRPDSFVLFAFSWVAVSICFVGIMMLLSVLGRSERSVGGFTWATLVAMAMLGGGMLPLFFMPEWMRTLSHISPVKWAILSIEGAIWRGFAPGDMVGPWAALLLIGTSCFLLGLRAFHRLEKD